ncbi:MAG: hypothetical protein AAFV78_10445 [Bacteroidota bacterium]
MFASFATGYVHLLMVLRSSDIQVLEEVVKIAAHIVWGTGPMIGTDDLIIESLEGRNHASQIFDIELECQE